MQDPIDDDDVRGVYTQGAVLVGVDGLAAVGDELAAGLALGGKTQAVTVDRGRRPFWQFGWISFRRGGLAEGGGGPPRSVAGSTGGALWTGCAQAGGIVLVGRGAVKPVGQRGSPRGFCHCKRTTS